MHEKIQKHPLPWRIEQDWTYEVYDAKDRIVLKCINWAEAHEFVTLAEELVAEDKKLSKEVAALIGDTVD